MRQQRTPGSPGVRCFCRHNGACDHHRRENSTSHWLLALFAGLTIGTPCYVAWQIVALAVRQLMNWLLSPAS
jgi:hypothetical protein